MEIRTRWLRGRHADIRSSHLRRPHRFARADLLTELERDRSCSVGLGDTLPVELLALETFVAHTQVRTVEHKAIALLKASLIGVRVVQELKPRVASFLTSSVPPWANGAPAAGRKSIRRATWLSEEIRHQPGRRSHRRRSRPGGSAGGNGHPDLRRPDLASSSCCLAPASQPRASTTKPPGQTTTRGSCRPTAPTAQGL